MLIQPYFFEIQTHASASDFSVSNLPQCQQWVYRYSVLVIELLSKFKLCNWESRLGGVVTALLVLQQTKFDVIPKKEQETTEYNIEYLV